MTSAEILRPVTALVALLCAATAQAQSGERVRMIFETDASYDRDNYDPDDRQSLVRAFLYFNEWDVEGILCTAQTSPSGRDTMLSFIQKYEQVYPTLSRHAPNYPTPAYLRGVTRQTLSDGKDVDLVISVVDRADPRPVWFCNWGTFESSALGRALDRVRAQRGQAGYETFKNKLRVIGDGFRTPKLLGSHLDIAPAFKLLLDPFMGPDNFRYYHRFGRLTLTAGGFDLQRDVLSVSPWGSQYPTDTVSLTNHGGTWTSSPNKEGDFVCYMHLIPTGMNDPNNPGWGSWAGRFGKREDRPEPTYYWMNQVDTWNGTTDRDNVLKRWAADLQRDFAARVQWTVRTYADANHPPVANVNGALARTVSSGSVVTLDATGSSDPDGDGLSYVWEYYREPGTYGGALSIQNATSRQASFVAPTVTSSRTIHVILHVRDNGSPPLARYRRVIVTVQPGGTVAPTVITSPAAGAVLAPGQTVTATGTGTNLAWEVDRIGDGLASFKTGTGTSFTFTVPSDATSSQTIRLILRGDGGTAQQDHSINAAAPPPPPSGGLVGHWKFDEGTGTTASDASGQGNTGTLRNGPAWTTGRLGGALSFDGANDFVQVPDAPGLDVASLTVAAWVYMPSAAGGWRMIASRQAGTSGQEHFLLGIRDGASRFSVRTAAGYSPSTAGPAAPLGRWFHMAGTYDGSSVRMYMDGALVYSAAHSGAIPGDSTPVLIGGNSNDGTGGAQEIFQGRLDDVRIYNRALNAQEVAGLAGGTTSSTFSVKVDSVSTGKAYSLSTAKTGALVYIDRSYVITSVTSGLSGRTMIRTANDDKAVTANPHLRFTVSHPAKVYVCLHGLVTKLPSWMNDGTWSATSESLGVDLWDGPLSKVYVKSVPAGQVGLGGNHTGGDTGARANYVVVVAPQ